MLFLALTPRTETIKKNMMSHRKVLSSSLIDKFRSPSQKGHLAAA